MSALGRGDGIDKIVLRSLDLPNLVEDRQDRTQTVRRCAFCR